MSCIVAVTMRAHHSACSVATVRRSTFFFSTLRFIVRVDGSAVRIVEKESSRVRVNDKKCVSL